jgi:hypothetical protein
MKTTERKLTRTRTLLFALQDAIDWELSFLDAIKDCHDDSNNEVRVFANNLIVAYKKEQLRLRKPTGSRRAAQ